MGGHGTPRPQSVPDFATYNSPVTPGGRPISMRPDDTSRSFVMPSPVADCRYQQKVCYVLSQCFKWTGSDWFDECVRKFSLFLTGSLNCSEGCHFTMLSLHA